jgi:hypothetical protein
MIAYNKTWLDNLSAKESVKDAFYADLITDEERKKAESIFIVGFYSPNIFIRIGLFILTLVIACFSFGLLCLLFLDNIVYSLEGLTLFFGLLSYGALELVIRIKHHYRSGVDDALLWIAFICLVALVVLFVNLSLAGIALVVFLLSLYFFLRFTDMLMAAVAGLSLLATIFYYFILLGSMAKTTVPFLMMAVAGLVYFYSGKLSLQQDTRFYRKCFTVIRISMLICFYAAANYLVVREVSNEMFGLALKANESIPYGWLFWILTIIIPLAYVFAGVKRKDVLLLRVGLLCIAAIVFTVRYYHTVLPIEIVMFLAGMILVAVSYLITRYLMLPRKGFTSAEPGRKFLKGKINAEALVISETFTDPMPENDTKFGGGSFGGGGASGDY